MVSNSNLAPSYRTVQLKNGKDVLIRKIERRDVNQIWENFNQVVAEEIYLPVYTPVIDEWEKKAWYKEITRGGNFCVVAEDKSQPSGEEIIGQCTIENLHWEAAEHVGQLGIIVKKGFRDQGIGYHLIEFCKILAQSQGKKKLILSTFNTNQMGFALYQKCGFKEIGRYTKQYYVHNTYVDEILMELLLEEY